VYAINCTTKEVEYYNSTYAAEKDLRINTGIVKLIFDKKKKKKKIYIYIYKKKKNLYIFYNKLKKK